MKFMVIEFDDSVALDVLPEGIAVEISAGTETVAGGKVYGTAKFVNPIPLPGELINHTHNIGPKTTGGADELP